MTMTDRPLPAWLAFAGGDEPLSDDELDAQVAAESSDLDDEQPRERFRVTDDQLAEWAMRKLAAVESERSEVVEQATAWRDEIDRWQSDRLRPLDARRQFFEGVLTEYLHELRDADPKVKSRKLPSGTIRSTASGAKVDVSDADAVIAWAESELPPDEAALVVQRTCQLSELRKVATVSESETGMRYVATLDCGHYSIDEVTHDELDDGDELFEVELSAASSLLPVEGDERECHECGGELHVVRSVEREPIVELVVRDNDTGQPVPGASVRPASVSYSVKVGG